MRFFLLLTVLITGLTTGPAFGQAGWGSKPNSEILTTDGLGSGSCGTWTARRTQGRPHAWGYEQWLLGFLSGAGMWGKTGLDPLNNVDANGVWAWVDNFCRDHPLTSLEGVGINFIEVHPR